MMTMKGGNLGPYVVPRVTLMMTPKRRMRKKRKGGALPLAAIVPGLIAAGKTAGLSALGGAASLATQAGLKRLTRRKRKKPAMR